MAGGALLVRTAEHSFVGTVKAVRHGQPDAP
jgi:hypothetical protein